MEYFYTGDGEILSTDERIEQALDNKEWRKFRVSLEGRTTGEKLVRIREYFETSTRLIADKANFNSFTQVDLDNELEDVRIRVDDYLKWLSDKEYIAPNVNLDFAVQCDWNVAILK